LVTIVGYAPKKSIVGKELTLLRVLLDPSDESMDAVVVVGYATQKKVNLTGSVSSISSKSLADRPITNTSSALAGVSAGVRVRQTSGRPGSDGASIQIRGLGTLSSASILVLIDGIQGSLDAVNPLDIDNISILKDASASIYGSLAANGVILVTTKKGVKNKNTVTYSGMLSTSSPMNTTDFVTNYADHMRLTNEGYLNVGQSPIFSPLTIAAWDSTSKIPNSLNPNGVPNYVAYPNTNWSDAIFKNQLFQTHNISLSGGTDKTTYLFSINYMNNQGVMENTGNRRFQLRSNIESKINKILTVGTQTFVSKDFYQRGDVDNAFNYLYQTTPGVYPKYNDKFGFAAAPEESSTANNILAYLYNTGGNNEATRFNTTLYANLNLYKGLVFETKFNYQTRYAETDSYSIPAEKWEFGSNTLKSPLPSPSTLSTSYSFSKDYAYVIDNVLRYTTTLGKYHDLSALVGYNERYTKSYNIAATKLGLIDYAITAFNSATTPTATSGGASEAAIRSFFGRVNYAYKNRYLLEGNLRRDGVSRFSPESRWGLFPSVSAGWKISDEAFMKGTRGWLSSLKLRASYGQLGNTASGLYDWQSSYGIQNYSFNNVQTSALATTRISNPLLQWENSYIKNIGIDGGFFNNRLSFELDIYDKFTDGILTSVPIPLTVGTASAPVINAAGVGTKGFELTAGWKGDLAGLHFNLSGNFAYNNNKVTKYKGQLSEGWVVDATGNKVYQSNLGLVSAGGSNRILENYIINEYYLLDVYKGTGNYFNTDGTVNISGGPTDGMIRTPDDLKWAQAMLAAGYKLLPAGSVSKAAIYYGDIIYADNNGDGLYGNSFDNRFTGTSSLPKYIFGFNADFNFKGFDLSMIWAGAAGMQYYWNSQGYNGNSVRNGFAFSKLIMNDRYYYNDVNPSDPNNRINSRSVRLRASDPQNNASSRFWLYDGSYVKLKNIQLGYNIPANITSKALISKARVFASAENLLMITAFPGLDAEIGSGVTYPTMKQFSFGVNVTF